MQNLIVGRRELFLCRQSPARSGVQPSGSNPLRCKNTATPSGSRYFFLTFTGKTPHAQLPSSMGRAWEGMGFPSQKFERSGSFTRSVQKTGHPNGCPVFWHAVRDSTCAAAQATSGCNMPPACCQVPSGSNPTSMQKTGHPKGCPVFWHAVRDSTP